MSGTVQGYWVYRDEQDAAPTSGLSRPFRMTGKEYDIKPKMTKVE